MIEKILDDNGKIYRQDNNEVNKKVSCNTTDLAMGLDIVNLDLLKIPGTYKQTEDRLTKIALDKNNWKQYADYMQSIVPENETDWMKWFAKNNPAEKPQILAYIANMIYQKEVATFTYGVSFRQLKLDIDHGNPVIICGDFTPYGHYVLCVGYKSGRDIEQIIVNDPAWWLYKSGNGSHKIYEYLAKNGTVLLNNPDRDKYDNNIKLNTFKIVIKND
jgi:D-ribose pyranose/furanose isomerase RbsD